MLRAVSRSVVSRRFLSRFDSGSWWLVCEGERGESGHPVSSIREFSGWWGGGTNLLTSRLEDGMSLEHFPLWKERRYGLYGC